MMYYYVAETRCLCGNALSCKETWTVRARGIKDARRRLTLAAGVEPHAIHLVPNYPRRHWRAG